MIFILIINDLFIYASLAKPPIALTTWIQKKKGGGGRESNIRWYSALRLFENSILLRNSLDRKGGRVKSFPRLGRSEEADCLRKRLARLSPPGTGGGQGQKREPGPWLAAAAISTCPVVNVSRAPGLLPFRPRFPSNVPKNSLVASRCFCLIEPVAVSCSRR